MKALFFVFELPRRDMTDDPKTLETSKKKKKKMMVTLETPYGQHKHQTLRERGVCVGCVTETLPKNVQEYRPTPSCAERE